MMYKNTIQVTLMLDKALNGLQMIQGHRELFCCFTTVETCPLVLSGKESFVILDTPVMVPN